MTSISCNMVANKVTLAVTLTLVFLIQIDGETPKDDRSKLMQLSEALIKNFIEGYANMAKSENDTDTGIVENDLSSAARVSKPVTIKPDNRSKFVQLFDAAANQVLSAIENQIKDRKADTNRVKNHTAKDVMDMFEWKTTDREKKRQRHDVDTYLNSAKVYRNEFASIGNSMYEQIFAMKKLIDTPYTEYGRKRRKTWW